MSDLESALKDLEASKRAKERADKSYKIASTVFYGVLGYWFADMGMTSRSAALWGITMVMVEGMVSDIVGDLIKKKTGITPTPSTDDQFVKGITYHLGMYAIGYLGARVVE